MNFDDLKGMYDHKKSLYGDKAYLHVSEIFEEAREQGKRDLELFNTEIYHLMTSFLEAH